MNRIIILFAIAMMALPNTTMSQEKSPKEQQLGTWTLVSHQSTWYGTNPKGVALFDAGGRFIITVMRSDRPKYPIDHPAKGTDEENKATDQGVMAYFGTYSVSEADHTIAIHTYALSRRKRELAVVQQGVGP